MSDFSVTVGGDFSELLSGFKQVERTAAASGQAAGQALGGGIQGATQRSIDALLADLGRLKAQKASISVDGSQVNGLTQQITAVQKQIDTLRATRVAIQADPRTLDGLNQKLSSLRTELGKVEIGSQKFKDLQGEIRKTEKELGDATQSAGGFKGVVQSLGPVIAAIGIGAGLVSFAKQSYEAAVAAESAQVRIKALGDQFGESDQIQRMVAQSAKLLNISNTEAADGFLQLYGALRPTGISLEDIGTTFTATNAAAKNFGLSAGSVQSAVLQLSQGLAAGTLQGDELRSIMEQMPPVAQAIAKELGITVGQVKKFGSEGKITSDIVIKAIKGMNETELSKLTTTLQSTAERINAQKVAWNELSVVVGDIFVRASLPLIDASTKIAQGLTSVAQAAASAPGPIKALAAAVLGLPALYAAARLAVVAFNNELIGGGMIKKAVEDIKLLGALLKQQFVADVATAKVAWIAFKESIQTGALQQQIVALVARLGPLAVAAIGVAAAFASYNASTADSQKIAESAAAGQDELTKALAAAGVKAGELTTLGGPFARAWQNTSGAVENFLGFLKQIPAIGNLVAGALKPLADAVGFLANAIKKYWQDANDTQGLEQATVALGNLQAQAGAAQNAAGRLFAELKIAGGPPNTQQTEQINKVGQALNAAKNQAGALQNQYTQLAAAARNSGNEQLAKQYEVLANAAGVDIRLSDVRLQQLNSLLPSNQKITAATKEQEAAIKARAQAEDELNKILSQAPVRNLEAQLAVGQQLLGLTKAVGDLEQSRFSVAKAGLQFELKALQDRGAGESLIAAKKAEIDSTDRAALSARYQSLTQQQALEQAMLQLSQEKARTESNLEIMNQKSKILEKQGELLRASTAEEKANIQAQINFQQASLGVLEEKAGTLAKTQPIERAIAAATAETARNGLQAEAAAQGFRIAADGSLVKTQGLANSIKNVAVFSEKSATEQDRYRRIAEQSGLAIGKAANGSVVLGRTQQEVNKAVGEMNKQLGGAKAGYDNSAKAAGQVKTATDQTGQALQNAGQKAGDLSKGIGDGAKAAGTAKTAADGLGKSLDAGKAPAGAIAGAFTSTGKSAPAAAQGARDFAAYLSSAKTFAERIASLNLGDRMASVRDATRDAATQARTFYDWLLKASGLPGSRWSGGPVDAGSEYRINELGQEAFLSAGRLSLINAPANALWRAPSSGVVVPAGITARLQDAGALPGPGRIAAVGGHAELAIEIGKLRQEVGELARKQWNISVTQRTGPTGSQVLRTLQQLR